MFVQVEAEKVPEVSGHLGVTAVPTFIFLSRGDVVDRLEGYDPAGLYSRAERHATNALQPSAGGAENAQANGQAVNALTQRLRSLTSAKPVMLFLKGSPDAPRCGFSRRVVDALTQAQIPFGHFDILQDEQVRTCACVARHLLFPACSCK